MDPLNAAVPLEAWCSLYQAISELGASYFDDAMKVCGSEREAAQVASCQLVGALGSGPLLRRLGQAGRNARTARALTPRRRRARR